MLQLYTRRFSTHDVTLHEERFFAAGSCCDRGTVEKHKTDGFHAVERSALHFHSTPAAVGWPRGVIIVVILPFHASPHTTLPSHLPPPTYAPLASALTSTEPDPRVTRATIHLQRPVALAAAVPSQGLGDAVGLAAGAARQGKEIRAVDVAAAALIGAAEALLRVRVSCACMWWG